MIQSVTEYLSVFSPNAEKYGPEKTPYLHTFHAVNVDMWKTIKILFYNSTFTFSIKNSLILPNQSGFNY